MTDHYQHLIQEHIKNLYSNRLIAPIFYLLFLGILYLILPLSQLIHPVPISTLEDLQELEKKEDSFITLEGESLYFTGYTNTFLGRTTGYYYYTIFDDQCLFLLLSPSTSEHGNPTIDQLTIYGQLKTGHHSRSFSLLKENFAKDLNWSPSALQQMSVSYYISEPAFHGIFRILFLGGYFVSGVYACLSILFYALYIRYPVTAPCCRILSRFGQASSILEEAERELATLPQLATEDMYITEHYFIELSNYGITIVPIEEIIWIYKYSTLHKFLWHHFSISYTLHITANKHLYTRCPKNLKSDIDGIIDYLAEANHNILVGFSEENRLKVEAIQDDIGFFSKLFHLPDFAQLKKQKNS